MLWGASDGIAFDASAELADLLVDVVKADKSKPIPSELREFIIGKLKAWEERHGVTISWETTP